LLVGANAQGKTSLLEAIHFLTGGSSPHTTSDRQLINFLALDDPLPFTRIAAELKQGERLQQVELRVLQEMNDHDASPRIRKEVKINGVKRRIGDLAGVFTAVMFLPQDLRVVEGPPVERRKFLDHALSQGDPVYANTLLEFNKVLPQRNALLKQLQERPSGMDELAFWDDQLCEAGAALIRARALALTELERLSAPIHRALTRGHESLRLQYQPSYDPLRTSDAQIAMPLDTPVDRTGVGQDAIRSGMRSALKRMRADELGRGVTLLGPHRDDFGFVVDGIDLRLYGSRGQNRTAILSTQLAAVDWLTDRTGESPLLLLDEMLAELDPQRREDVLARVRSADQAILTAADLEMFPEGFRRDATLWEIRAGSLSPFRD
jgi:DNA replication and repair protein RecF